MVTISTMFCNIKTSLNISYVSASRSKDLFYHKNFCVSMDKLGFYSEVGTEFLCIIQLNLVAKLWNALLYDVIAYVWVCEKTGVGEAKLYFSKKKKPHNNENK